MCHFLGWEGVRRGGERERGRGGERERGGGRIRDTGRGLDLRSGGWGGVGFAFFPPVDSLVFSSLFRKGMAE